MGTTMQVARRLPWVVPFAGVFFCASACLGGAPTSLPSVDPTLDDPQATLIEYAAPAADPDARWHAVVVVPRGYGELREASVATESRVRYPVVYMLHGYGVDHTRWYTRMRELGAPMTEFADRFNVILVFPEGKPNSWYLDAPDDGENPRDYQVETVITRHLVPEIDRRFRTWREPRGRGVTGISMGGHGAIYLGARHPDLFGACSSMSGVLDLRDSMNKAPLAARIGSLEERPERWVEHSCMRQAERFAGRGTAILLDCGWDDPFIGDNRALHEKLMRMKVAHDYIERPGKHDWDYWKRAMAYHLQFLTEHLKPAAPLPGGEPSRN